MKTDCKVPDWTKGVLQELLKFADITFSFRKADGSNRVLTATRNVPDEEFETISENRALGQGSTSNLPNTHIRVYEKDPGQWRTIRLDTIELVEVHRED